MESEVATIIGVGFFVALEMLAAIFSNGFILIHIFLDFLCSNSVGPRDKILVALCAFSLCYTTMLSVSFLLELLSPWYNSSVTCFLSILSMFSFTSCSWLTACLCFFYCIKILHFKSRLLVQLQTKIQTVVPWLILVVEIISLCGSLSNLQLFLFPPKSGLNHELGNVSAGVIIKIPEFLYIVYTVNLVPSLIVMVTATSAVASLSLHIRRMRRSLETAGSTGMVAHYGALRTVLGLLCLYAMYNIAIILSIFFNYSINPIAEWTYNIIMFSFSTVQSAILIQGNPKLWGSVLSVAARLSCIRKPDSST